ncbi:hypothetical protein CNMCM5623_002154 [Aspergillus felis]|uniref:Uncharacterized protein n=1 Tax=Aspergillus felis TaxID=1287682 RepID=A0A8H6UZ09_9EURO|nr:hypothetical protein CNMCM5623_002154 [Aspergillus felis]
MADLRHPKSKVRVSERHYPCEVSRFLEAHGIPNVLWGELVMNAFLVPVVPNGVYFIIPDEHIDKARDLLVEDGLPPCRLGKYCGFDWLNSIHGIPYAHFNIIDLGPLRSYNSEEYGPNPRRWYTLELYKKSEMLWGAPEIPLGPPPLNDPDYWTINDERLPEVNRAFSIGRLVDANYPVKIPSPARYTEMLTLLYFRDNFPEETFRGSHWRYLLLDMLTVLEKHHLFELRDLPPRTRSWIKIRLKPWEKKHEDVEDRLGEEMRKSGEVPEKSPWPSAHTMPPGWREELEQWEEEEEQRKKKKEEEEQMRKKEEEVKQEQNV